MLNHGVSTGGLFMIVGMLSDRRHTRLISEFGGLKAAMPRLVAAFLLITLSSIALPGLNGFVGEFLILVGSFRWDATLTAFAASGVILSAVYMLWMFQRVNFGPITNEKNRALPDLTPREWALMVPTVAMAIVMGMFPGVFLRPMEPSVAQVIERVTGGQPQRVRFLPGNEPEQAGDRVAAVVSGRPDGRSTSLQEPSARGPRAATPRQTQGRHTTRIANHD
jgi:NADH-quinone oxidoreductase subunit M